MEAIQTWVSKNKLTTIGALWASGIGASLAYNSRKRSDLKPSLKLIHARMHAQALTLAVLSSAAVYHHYYEKSTMEHGESTHNSPK
ncbi:hypothetical protein RGQ29_021351 [Quercus rubra]|uniref:HIG1 domain-containing protein n=1 Tax=Quercus rubra TaxID=3512 RepID=A0AAN7FGF2_QUERU|nr:hypothetical protein RGQ29_021351 [Quercus rubra]